MHLIKIISFLAILFWFSSFLSCVAQPAAYFSPLDYGAKCNGHGDDSAAINTMMDAVRATVGAVDVRFPRGPGTALCVVRQPLNFTHLPGNRSSIFPTSISLNVLCQTNGRICVDATGSSYVRWTGLVYGSNATGQPSSIGFQSARESGSVDASSNTYDHLEVYGFFTFAAVYVMASEVNHWSTPVIIQQQANPGAYALVLDGENYWHASSSFQTITFSSPQTLSFNDNAFVTANIQNVGGGIPIWMANATAVDFAGSSYILGQSPSSTVACMKLVDDKWGGIVNLTAKAHCEKAASWFLFSGSNPTPTISGLSFKDYDPDINGAIFKMDAGLSSVTLNRLDVAIDNPGTYRKVFDTPAFTVRGANIWLQSSDTWATPNVFEGCVRTPTLSAC